MFPTYTLPSEPAPEGYRIMIGGVVCCRIYPTYDAAFTVAQDEGYDDYEIVPVEEIE
jgi:hypothetical protein